MAKKRHQRSGKRPLPASAQKLTFTVESIDPLGQGVSRDDGKISFIAKTLPGETGEARILSNRKGVRFAKLESLNDKSDKRIEAKCPHYDQCPGCQYLHTDYDSELEYKRTALQSLLQRAKLDVGQDIETLAAPRRFNYRNRMQLHYRHKYLGLVDALTDQIVEIPECQLLVEELKAPVAQLYGDREWAKERTGGGHCEVYFNNGEVSVEWDQPYAHGGFTQVYAEMNESLRDLIRNWLSAIPFSAVLDLFSGDGNLSAAALEGKDARRVMVDSFAANNDPDFYGQDLYDPGALKSLQRREQTKQFGLMILDPPRKGFADLEKWLSTYKPSHALYVSCNPATLVRDLRHCTDQYSIERTALLDLFPGTHHFETVVLLKRIK